LSISGKKEQPNERSLEGPDQGGRRERKLHQREEVRGERFNPGIRPLQLLTVEENVHYKSEGKEKKRNRTENSRINDPSEKEGRV